MRTYPVKVFFEADIEVNGWNYLVIYGKHANGYFCAIPNWNFACEMSEPSDTYYNFEKLFNAHIDKSSAKEIAKQIYEISERINKK